MNEQLAFGEDTLAIARLLVASQGHKGIRCPCCDLWVQVYRRRITDTMAMFLIWLVRSYEREPRWYNRLEGPLMNGVEGGPDYGKLRYWGLIVPCPNRKDAPIKHNPHLPPNRSGFWRPTERGIDFAHCRLALPERAVVRDDIVLCHSGPDLLISDCLEQYFDYWEMIGGRR